MYFDVSNHSILLTTIEDFIQVLWDAIKVVFHAEYVFSISLQGIKC